MKNVLFILTDQQRKDSLGCYGNPIVKTPNIDRLADNGMRFNRNYVANPICMPNRLSIFTGMYSRNHGLWTNGLNIQERRTLATELADKGYQTASFGKIHFTPTGGPAADGCFESREFWQQRGNDFEWTGQYWGFEHVELTIGHTEPLAHYGKWFFENGGTLDMLKKYSEFDDHQSGYRNLPAELHDSTFVAERTVEFISNERDENRPFFAVASFPDPHHPFNPPKETAEKYSIDDVVSPVGSSEDLVTRPSHYEAHLNGSWNRSGLTEAKHPGGLSEQQENARIAHTYAMVDLIDENVGKILNSLEAEGLLEDTIIVYTADHGELLGDHGLWAKGPFYYEGLMNVPLIISASGCIQPGVSNELISSTDIFPTICELLGVPIPQYVDGVSQFSLLKGEADCVRDKCLIEYRNGYGDNDCSSKAIVTKEWKYVRYQTGEAELTDLQNDPKERKNVVNESDYQDVVLQMNEILLDEILATERRWPKQVSHA